MRRFLLAFTALVGIGVAAAVADYTATQGAGTNFGSAVQATVHYAKLVLCDLTAPATQCATVSAAGAVKVDGSAVTQPVSGTVAVTGTVTANAGTNLNTSALALDATLTTTNTDLGPPGATACATDTGSCSLNALAQRQAQRLTTINTTLGTPFQAGGSIGNTSFGATQSGTWTVQPGNTPNSTAWLVTGSGGTFPVTATNLSTNINQVNGVTPLMDNGFAGAGAQRVVIASDNTPFSVNATLSAETTKVIGTVNQGTSPWVGNVSQINGVAPLMDNGASGTGAQRVSISNNNNAIPGWGHVATGAAPPTGSSYIGANTSGATGGLVQGLIQCDSTAIYDASTNGSTELVALTAGRTIYVCGFTIMAAGTVNAKLIYGTGTACATGATNMTPAWQLTTQVGLVDGSPFSRGLKTASANALCINTSAGIATQAIVYYAKL